MEAIVILCTAPATGDAAHELARKLVEAKLAACVNIVPGLRSIYAWQGKLEDEPEVQLLIKTRRDHYEDVERFIREHHPYTEPEILAIDVTRGSASYLEWLYEQTAR